MTRLQRLLDAAKNRPTRGGGAVKSDDGSSQMTLTADFITHHLRALDFGRRGKWSEMEAHLLRALAARPDEYWSLFRLARALDKLGRANEAEQVFLSCLALRPNSSHARAHRAYVLFGKRRWEDARAACEEALAIDPNNTTALSTLIVVQGNLRDVDAARGRYGELVRLATNDRLRSKAENALGVALENAKRLSEAIERYEAALKIDPENIAALRNRALAYMQTTQSNEALDVIQRAVELRPDLPEVHFVLANAFFGLRQYQEAEKAFTTAIELDPNFALAYYNRGVLRRKRNDLAAAMADQERALALSPNSANAHHERAQILGAQSRKPPTDRTRLLLWAVDEINRAIALRPEDADYLVTRAKLYGDLRHFDLAVADLDEAMSIQPEHQDARLTRGVILFERGDMAGLVADFLELIKRQPDHPQSAGLWNSIAVAREKLADIDGARDAFKSSLKIAWNSDHAENFAQLELGQRRLDVTIGLCDEILQRAPDRWRALALRGQSRFRIGDVTTAISDLDRAFELQPALVEARVLRAEANLLLGKVADARRDLQAVSINA
ncbi:MAG TPA: tetratricopeptide repeat protein, partial [Pirellulaceae bacterium]|nr:tetratricopeptide repeat protein [Pirellulaceae bacterium]